MVKNVTHYTQIEYIHEHTHIVSLTHTEDMCAHIQTLKHTRRPDTHQMHQTHIPSNRHTHTHTHTHTQEHKHPRMHTDIYSFVYSFIYSFVHSKTKSKVLLQLDSWAICMINLCHYAIWIKRFGFLLH